MTGKARVGIDTSQTLIDVAKIMRRVRIRKRNEFDDGGFSGLIRGNGSDKWIQSLVMLPSGIVLTENTSLAASQI